jgi:4,5:9,10-diseco-3-hydroxy-5,9,17-trioxoandrosta-1(10),2-diene-4-oate hydrolase
VLGTGTPPLILIHGLGGYLENWEPNVPALAQARRVYAVDLVGFGRSDKPQVDYSIPYFVAFIKDFMSTLGIEQAVLVGESMGGAIALRTILKYPHLVDKLVLAASAGFGRELTPVLRMMSLPLLGEYLSRPSREGKERLYKMVFHNPDIIQEEWIDLGTELAALPGAQQSLLRTTRALCNLWGVKPETYRPILDRLETIAVPALIIWGIEDRFIPVAHAHTAARLLPNATLKILDNCGHIPNVECPDTFNQAVLDFLAKS